MKKFAFICLIFMVACQTGIAPSDSKQPAIGVQFTITPKETIIIQGENLRITFMEMIEDSRCPTNVECVWAGRARAALSVEQGQDTARLDISTEKGKNVKNFGKYQITLIQVDPYPKSSGTPKPVDKYVLSLVVNLIPLE